jgi:hypothetical protein
MSQPRIIRGAIDAEKAVEDLANEHKRLAGMTGADSARIDALVGDVGTIKGNVQVVGAKVDGVASSVNELRDALTVLVRHDVQMQHQTADAALLRSEVATMSGRVQTLEKQVGPLIEMRTWVIGGGLGILALIGLAVAKLVMR